MYGGLIQQQGRRGAARQGCPAEIASPEGATARARTSAGNARPRAVLGALLGTATPAARSSVALRDKADRSRRRAIETWYSRGNAAARTEPPAVAVQNVLELAAKYRLGDRDDDAS